MKTQTSRTAVRSAALTVVAAAAIGLLPSAHGLEPPRGAVHRQNPKVDGTDFYMFRSYEPGRAGYVTLIANYLPLQDPYGGPNFFKLDPNALYEIHIDNNGGAQRRPHLPVPLPEHARRRPALNVGGKQVQDPADRQPAPITRRRTRPR